MLASIRKSAKSWAAAAILFLALVAMVITGFGTDGMGGLGGAGGGSSGDTLAKAKGDATLTEPEVSDIINRQYSQARQSQPDLTLRTFVESAFNPIVDQLILALGVQAFGDAQGLTVSQQMVDREIVNIPAFRNFAGQFDENSFRAALAQQNLTEAQLREDITRSLMQRQLLGPIARGASVPQGIAREYANLLLERRRGVIGVVPAEVLSAGLNPTDADLTAYYQANRDRFVIPERRIIRYAMIGPEQVAGASQATDQEIAAYYRENAARYGPRETRSLQQVVLQDEAAARAFVQRVQSGTSFADAAGAAGFAAGDITFADQTREAFASATTPQVAAAAFQGTQGAIVGPVRSELGFHVVRVDQVARTPGQPLASVREEIAAAVQERKLAVALDELVRRVEEAIADGASLEEAARAHQLTLAATPALTEQGQMPGQAFTLPPELQPIVRGGFEIDADDPEPLVEQLEANRRFALIGVERVIPAAPPPFAQIRDQVRAAYVQQQGLARSRQVAQQLAARINQGASARDAFAQVQPRLPAPEEVNLQRLEISRAGQQAPAPLITLFSLPQGRAHILQAPNNAGWFVVHHVERTPGSAADQPELIATTRNEFSATAAQELAEQFARAAQQASNVQRDQEAIARARQRLLGAAGE